MNSSRIQIHKAAIGASLLVAFASFSAGAFAQEDAKAIAAARTAYSAANTKINTDYKAAVGKCAGMSGSDKSVCAIDARATRSKARTDATATRDKAFAKANMTAASWTMEDPGGTGE